LSQKLDILLVTADTNKTAEWLVRDLSVKLYRIKETQENYQKLKGGFKKR